MTEEEVLAQEKEYIGEALNFVGVEFSKIEVKMGVSETPIIEWIIDVSDGLNKNVAGQYYLNTKEAARTSVIMSVAVARHGFSWLIFDTVVMASQVLSENVERNTLSEIVLRWHIRKALTRMPLKYIREYLEKVFNIQQNINEEQARYLAQKAKVN